MNVLIFSIFTIISWATSVFCTPKDFLFQFLVLEVGGIKYQPQRLASVSRVHSVIFSSPRAKWGHQNPGAYDCSGKICEAEGEGCLVVSTKDLVLKILGFPCWVTLRRKLP